MPAVVKKLLITTAFLVFTTANVLVQIYLASHSPTVGSAKIYLWEIKQDSRINNSNLIGQLRNKVLRKRDKEMKSEPIQANTASVTSDTGKINVHIWESICNPTVNSLRQYPLFPSLPNKRSFLPNLIAGSRGTWYGQRIVGYLHPAESGNYMLMMKTHLFGELWLSNSSDPRNAVLVAKVARSYQPKQKIHDKQITHVSRAIKLQSNQKYFIDILHVTNGGVLNRDYVKIQWKTPRSNKFQIVEGKHLSPLFEETEAQQRTTIIPNFNYLNLSPATEESKTTGEDVGEDDEDYNDVIVPAVTHNKEVKLLMLHGETQVLNDFTSHDFNILFAYIQNKALEETKNGKISPAFSKLLLKVITNMEKNNNTTQQFKDLLPFNQEKISKHFKAINISDFLPQCKYIPSYVKPGMKLKRYEGVWRTHYSSVFPDDNTSAFFCLGNKQKTDCSGNKLIKQEEVIEITKQLSKALATKYKRQGVRQYKLVSVVKVEKNHDPLRGARYFLELILQDELSGKYILISDYAYSHRNISNLCKPSNISWRSDVLVNIVLTVKGQGVWAQHFVNDLSRIVKETGDQNINVIVVEFNNADIDIEKVLQRSAIKRFKVLKRSGQFHKTKAIQSAVETVSDPHSIVLLLDLHLRMPSTLIDSVRKHTIEGRMCFNPVLFRLSFCGRPSNSRNISARRGFWETFGFGIIGIYKSDWTRIGGMDTEHFTNKWGGEDWDLIDRLLTAGLEVERLRIPGFYHFHHSKTGMWNKAL